MWVEAKWKVNGSWSFLGQVAWCTQQGPSVQQFQICPGPALNLHPLSLNASPQNVTHWKRQWGLAGEECDSKHRVPNPLKCLTLPHTHSFFTHALPYQKKHPLPHTPHAWAFCDPFTTEPSCHRYNVPETTLWDQPLISLCWGGRFSLQWGWWVEGKNGKLNSLSPSLMRSGLERQGCDSPRMQNAGLRAHDGDWQHRVTGQFVVAVIVFQLCQVRKGTSNPNFETP